MFSIFLFFLFLFFLIANLSFWVDMFLSLCFSWFLTLLHFFQKKVLISFSIFEHFPFLAFFCVFYVFIVSFLLFFFSFLLFLCFSVTTTLFQKMEISLPCFLVGNYVFVNFLCGKLFQKWFLFECFWTFVFLHLLFVFRCVLKKNLDIIFSSLSLSFNQFSFFIFCSLL